MKTHPYISLPLASFSLSLLPHCFFLEEPPKETTRTQVLISGSAFKRTQIKTADARAQCFNPALSSVVSLSVPFQEVCPRALLKNSESRWSTSSLVLECASQPRLSHMLTQGWRLCSAPPRTHMRQAGPFPWKTRGRLLKGGRINAR